MRERILFHLRLGDSSCPRRGHVQRESSSPIEGLPATSAQVATSPNEEAHLLTCTCVHSSSPSCVVVGFEKGVVHVYHREGCSENARQVCEEEKWKRSVLYPTLALSSSPNGLPVVPDITCVSVSPSGDRLAVGTSDGFVFVTQVRRCGGRRGQGSRRAAGLLSEL